jgi:hypothetical protein
MVLLLLPRLTRHEQNDLFCWSQPDLSRNDDGDVVALKEEQLVGGDSDDKTLSFPTNTAATGETGKSLRGNAISSLLGPASTNRVYLCVCVCVLCVCTVWRSKPAAAPERPRVERDPFIHRFLTLTLSRSLAPTQTTCPFLQ